MAGKLTAKQQAFARYLVAGHSVPSAGQETGISERTAWRWWAMPLVRDAVRRGHADALHLATAQLTAGMGTAVKVLLDIMADDKMPASVRARAASDWIGNALKLLEVVDLDARIAALEARAEGGNHGDAEA